MQILAEPLPSSRLAVMCVAYSLVFDLSLTFSDAGLGVRDVYRVGKFGNGRLISGLVIARVAQRVFEVSYGAFSLY